MSNTSSNIQDTDAVVSEQGAAELMKMLLQRGYFHDNVEIVRSIEDRRHKKEEDAPIISHYTEDDNATVLATSFGTYLTRDCFEKRFRKELDTVGGRWTVEEAAAILGVAENHVEAMFLKAKKEHSSVYWVVGKEMLTQSYLKQAVERTVALLRLSEGTLLVADMARLLLKLPLETTMRVLQQEDFLPNNVCLRTLQSGAQVLVTQDYLDAYKSRVHGAFLAVTKPVHVQDIAKERQWDADWVLEWLKELHTNGQLPGDVHGDVYIPTSYTNRQKRSIVDFFSANGFVTTDQCQSMGVLPSQMRLYITEAYPDALVLKEVVVHLDFIVRLEALLQETINAAGWLDLHSHFPAELLSHQDDARTILNDHVLSNLKSEDESNDGVAVLSQDGALFMSRAMIDEVSKERLVPLIEPFAKSKAKELDQPAGEVAAAEPVLTAKEKRKAKKATKSSKHITEQHPASDAMMLPLSDIVHAVVNACPDLSDLDTEDNGAAFDGSLLSELCRQAFCTADFRSACQAAVQAELRQLESDRASKAKRSHKNAASKEQDVQVSFEDPRCFAAACYSIQLMAGFLEYAANTGMDDDSLDKLKTDCLQGCCVDFTRRITQFCLFKYEVDDDIFSFETESGSILPHYCSPVDPAIREYKPIFLSCTPDEDMKPRDSLPTLRNVLPVNVGTSLARQWILCGGQCYQGGQNRPGDLDGFLAHVEENCLTICGLPFKKLDKKSKKQFLQTRRQRIVQLLEDEAEAEAVLDLSVMHLYQLIKNNVVSGRHLHGIILQLLAKERKLSEGLSTKLLDLAQRLDKGEKIAPKQIEEVKACALGREG